MFFNNQTLFKQPERIVSLVPSLTELLVDLGKSDEIVGITKFCIHPEYLKKEKTIVGGTKNPNIEKIIALKPDFILVNDEENNLSDVELLAQSYPVYVTSIKTISDNNQTILDLGKLLNTENIANRLVENIEVERYDLQRHVANKQHLKGLYLIWKKPYMSIGNDTFIHAMLQEMKINNVFEHQTRYPTFELGDDMIKPDVIFLSSEPYPFNVNDISCFQKHWPNSKIFLVDGEFFSWYGSRVMGSFSYFKELINRIIRK